MTLREKLEKIQPPNPYKGGGPAVYPEEPKGEIEVVAVGEAPGKNEVKQGKPFCGMSGQLLRELVSEAGLSSCHYTNASYYRPPVRGGKDSRPTEQAIRAERPRLLMEIALLRPRKVVALGATAAYALCGQVPRSRGMVRRASYLGHEYHIWITRHPAALLYEPDYYRDLVTDLRRVAENRIPEKQGIRGQIERGSRQILEGRDEVVFVSPKIYIDTEATGTHFSTAGLLCVSVTDGDKTYIWGSDNESLSRLNQAIYGYGGEIIGHNTAGDEILLRRHGVDIRFTGDTLLRHYSQDERKGSHGLKSLAPAVGEINTKIDLIWPYLHGPGAGGNAEGDDTDERGGGWKEIPLAVLQEYCAADSYATSRVDERLADSEDGRSIRVYRFLQRANRAFTEGVCQGIRVDESGLGASLKEQEDRVQILRESFNFDPEKRTEVLRELRACGFNIESTRRAVLQELDGELPKRILEYRREAKLLTGFLRPLTNEWAKDGVVHPAYRLFGTESGRTSCREPNVQQIPQSLKRLFVARPGHLFVGWDMKQHEVRGLAFLSKDQALCHLLRDKTTDPHEYVSRVLGLPERKQGKTALFASAYGARENKLRAVGMSRDQAREALRLVADLFPQLPKWKESVVKQIWEQGHLETPHYGRRRYFYYMSQRTRGHQERVGINFLPQSLCADICLDGAVTVYERLGLAPLIFVHDFNLVEVPEDRAFQLADDCYNIASNVFPNDLVDFIPEIKIGSNWGDLHTPEDEDEEDDDLLDDPDSR